MNRKLTVFFVASLLAMISAQAQDAKPEDENSVNSKRKATGSMLDDSPVTFPEKGALPTKFPTDLKTVSQNPKDNGYSITSSPPRSAAQIAAIQAEMPKGEFTPPATDWQHLPQTRKALMEGGELHIVGLGDSIINDTFRSGWLSGLALAYPQAEIRGNVYVRGGGACYHYRLEQRVPKYLIPLKPDLVFIGGISQHQDYEAIRDVIGQIREGLPTAEIVLASGAFGNVDPRRPDLLATSPHSGSSDYGAELRKIAADLDCAFLDMTSPWAEYIRSSGEHPHRFYRDRVHANAYGEQILAKIIVSFFDVNR